MNENLTHLQPENGTTHENGTLVTTQEDVDSDFINQHKLTPNAIVYDSDSDTEIAIEPWMQFAIVFFERAVSRMKIMEAAVFSFIKEKKLYLAVNGISSFQQYCESDRCRIDRRQVYNYIKLFDRIKDFIPVVQHNQETVHFLHKLQKGALKTTLKADLKDEMRILFDFEAASEPKKQAWQILSNTNISSLIELAKSDEIDFSPTQYGAGIEMPDGSLLMSKDLPSVTLKEIRKRLKPNPKTEARPDLVLKEDIDPVEAVNAAIDNAARFLRQARGEVARIKTDERTFERKKKEIRQIFYQVKQLLEYGENEANFIGDSDDLPKKTGQMVKVSDVAAALGLSSRFVRNLSKDMPVDSVEVVSGPAGKAIYLNPEALPEEYRLKWQQCEAAKKLMSREEREAIIWSQATQAQREHAGPYLELIKITSGLRGTELEAAIDKYNADNPGQKDIALTSFYRQKKDYKENGIEALLPGWGKNAGKSKVNPEDAEYFASLYISQNKPSAQYCWEQTVGKASREGRIIVQNGQYMEVNLKTGEVFQGYPVCKTVLSAVENRYTKEAIEYGREGEKKFKKSAADYHIDRDLSNKNAGDIWVSDHRQIDLLCISDERRIQEFSKKVLHAKMSEHDKKKLSRHVRNLLAGAIKNKKPFRPWLTAWIDMKTAKWISWSLHADDPNTGHIMQTLKWGVEKYGAPKWSYMDNGKDYRKWLFSGNRTHYKLELDENEIKPLCYQLGIIPIFANPYNARAKMIERQFQLPQERYEKMGLTYTGKNASERPESTNKNIKKGLIPDFNQVCDDFDRLIPLINREPRQGKEHMGMSPDQLWDETWKLRRPVSSAALKLFCMEYSNPKQLKANGYYDNTLKRFYYAPWMAGMYKRKVILMRDPENWQQAWVLDADTKKVLGDGPAELIRGTDGVADSPEEKQHLDGQFQIQAQRKQIRKESLKGLKKISNGEIFDNYEEAINLQEQLSDFEPAAGSTSIIPMPSRDTQLDDLAEQISSIKTRKEEKENLDLDLITPPENHEPEDDYDLLDTVDISDFYEDDEEQTIRKNTDKDE